MHGAPPSRSDGGWKAEQFLYDALRRGLDDEFHVYYRVGVVERERAREAEADFVVLHRERGLLLIECKGSGVRRLGDGRWVRASADGGEQATKDPFRQAQDARHALVSELQSRMTSGWPRHFPFVHGHAVAFPRAGETATPLDGPRETVLFAGDLDRIAEWTIGAMEFWGRGGAGVPPLDAGEFRRFRDQILHPRLDFVPRLGAQLRAEGEELCRLTEAQGRTLRGLFVRPRLRVAGGAGTGKTMLALEAARRLAVGADGERRRVLLACYNKQLADYLTGLVDAWSGPSESDPPLVDVAHFHRLCFRAYQALGRPFEPPATADAASTFWETDAPAVLFDALAEGALEPWDAIVVDEGQDFAEAWWTVLEEAALREPGRLYVFLDPAQKIFPRHTGRTDRPIDYELTDNLRNTRAIAEVVRDIAGVPLEPHPDAPAGAPVCVHLEQGAKARRLLDDLVADLVGKQRVLPDQIVVIGPHRPENERSTLHGVTELGGVAVTADHRERDRKILLSTIGAFKGLESDVVILVDIDPADERCTRGARYVATSRARTLLHVFARGEWRE